MSLKLMFRVSTILLVFCIFLSMSTVVYADNKSKTIPTIIDFDTNTFVRSDGSVWVLRGQQLIPTQVIGISNATKVIADNFIYTSDGKNFALNKHYDVVVPIELEVTGEIKRVLSEHFITTSGEVYYYYLNTQTNLNYSQDATFTKITLPFLVEDIVPTHYGGFLFLTKEGEVWIGDNIDPKEKIGEQGVRYTQLFNLGAVDEKKVIWSYKPDYNTNTSTFSPIKSPIQIQEIDLNSTPITALTKDAKQLFYINEGWANAIVDSPDVKVNKIMGGFMGSDNYYYLTTDHKLYIRFSDNVLIADNVLDFSVSAFTHLLFLKQDGKLSVWPSSAVKKKNEKVVPNYSDKTSYELQTPISVFVNNKLIPMPKGAWLIDNTTYLPLRSIFTELGANVSWDNPNKTASFSLTDTGIDKLISINYSKQEVYINNVKISFEHDLFLDENSAFVPLRLVSEGLGVTVSWDAKTASIYINSKK